MPSTPDRQGTTTEGRADRYGWVEPTRVKWHLRRRRSGAPGPVREHERSEQRSGIAHERRTILISPGSDVIDLQEKLSAAILEEQRAKWALEEFEKRWEYLHAQVGRLKTIPQGVLGYDPSDLYERPESRQTDMAHELLKERLTDAKLKHHYLERRFKNFEAERRERLHRAAEEALIPRSVR